MNILMWLLAGHFLGDFAFQSEWMAKGKSSSWELNAYHAATYAAAMLLAAGVGGFPLSPAVVALFFTTHFLIDPLKARWGIVKRIWLDQLLHFAVILLAAWMMA